LSRLVGYEKVRCRESGDEVEAIVLIFDDGRTEVRCPRKKVCVLFSPEKEGCPYEG